MHLLFRTCNILFVLGNLMGSGIIAQDILSDGFREPLSNVQQEIASLYPSRVKDPISRKNLYRSGHYNVFPLPVLQDSIPSQQGTPGAKRRWNYSTFLDSRLGWGNQAIGWGAAGLGMEYSPNDRLHLRAGYAFAGGQLADFIGNFADSTGALPRWGHVQSNASGRFMAHVGTGQLRWQWGKRTELAVGRDRQFVGDGYRSMILSDHAGPIPYLRLSTALGPFRYTNTWFRMRDLSNGRSWQQPNIKYSAMHALSWNIHRRWTMAIHEWVIWQERDGSTRRLPDLYYLNPLIFYRPVEYSIGSPDNVILGFTLRHQASKKCTVYGQFVLDEFNIRQLRLHKAWWGNKVAAQFGMKYFDILPGLHAQTEVNVARPFTYSHGSPVQAWTQGTLPLAHPLGANFAEWCNIIRYNRNSWSFLYRNNWLSYGRDWDADGDGSIDRFGGNITSSYEDPFGGPYFHTLMQGRHYTTWYQSLTIVRALAEDSPL
ncbi:MAG: hypothetical protein ACKO66_01895, partial [Flavobacteriales bacterium]